MTLPSAPRQPTPSRETLWEAEDVVRWLALTTVAVVLWVAGSFLASGEVSLTKQVIPANLAVGGLILFGAANVLWILRGRRAVGRRMSRALDPYEVDLAAASSVPSEDVLADDGRFIALAAGIHFHRATCLLVSGRPPGGMAEASAQEHRTSGRRPCGICLG